MRELADVAFLRAEIWGVTIRRDPRQGIRRWELEVMKVKHSNWFAAGPEVSRALTLLSDGAFRLYFYLCLQAGRDDGSVAVSYFDVAHTLGKSRRSIATYFEELRRNGVCRIDPAVNQHQSSKIEICDEFWPYTRSENEPRSPVSDSYFQRVRSLLSARACVKCSFAAADQKIRRNSPGPRCFSGADRACHRAGMRAKVCESVERNRQRADCHSFLFP